MIVQEIVVVGVNVVMFSGDKLFGGLQVGLIVGDCVFVVKIKKYLFKCVLCVGKLMFVVFEFVLWLYQLFEFLCDWFMMLCLLMCLQCEIVEVVECVCLVFQVVFGSGFDVMVELMFSQIGSGVLLVDQLLSVGFVVCLVDGKCSGCVFVQFEKCLCEWLCLVIGCVVDNVLWFDLCCVEVVDEVVFVV